MKIANLSNMQNTQSDLLQINLKEVKSYYGITYPSDMLNGDENAVLGELPAGRYRIAIERNGKVYETLG